MGTLGGVAGTARIVALAGFALLVACPSDGGGVSPTCTDELFVACNVNADCCGWATSETYCVDGACVPTCSANADCVSECCAESSADIDVCWLQSACGQCIFDGNACTRNDDCCGWDDGSSSCFNSGEFPAPFGQCVPSCTADVDCATGCCIETDLGNMVCAPAGFCGACSLDGQGCETNGECCDFEPDLGLCVDNGALDTGQCVRFCSRDLECATGCCAPLTDGRTVCSPAAFCDDALCDDTCNFPGDGECDDGGPGSVTSLCEFGTDCTDCGPRSGSAPP